jgi:hypothetical protein
MMYDVLSLIDLVVDDDGGNLGFITDSNTSNFCGSNTSNNC